MWERKNINTSRGSFEYFRFGKGEPLCITHQYIEFNEKGYTFAERFTQNYCVYLVNLKSCGNSDSVLFEEALSIKNSVLDLEAIRIALGLEKWGFAGHSTGGMIGLEYGINYSSSLTKIIIGGTCHSSDYLHHPESIYSNKNPYNKTLMSIIEQLSIPDLPLEERQRLNKEWGLISFHKKNMFDQLMKGVYLGKTNIRRLNYFRKVDINHFNVKEHLEKILVPTFIYAGKFDSQCPAIFCNEIASKIKFSYLKIFTFSDHNPFIEEAQEFNQFVRATN